MYHFLLSKGQSCFLLVTVAEKIDHLVGGGHSFYVVVGLFEWKHK